MSEFTPGPWWASPRHVGNDGTQDEMSGLGWDVEGPVEPDGRGQFAKAADAYLVAAAPELFDALRAALRQSSGWRSQAAIALMKASKNPKNLRPRDWPEE